MKALLVSCLALALATSAVRGQLNGGVLDGLLQGPASALSAVGNGQNGPLANFLQQRPRPILQGLQNFQGLQGLPTPGQGNVAQQLSQLTRAARISGLLPQDDGSFFRI